MARTHLLLALASVAMTSCGLLIPPSAVDPAAVEQLSCIRQVTVETPYLLELSEPLGDRMLLDGAEVPPRDATTCHARVCP
jgi:hypothetical protein